MCGTAPRWRHRETRVAPPTVRLRSGSPTQPCHLRLAGHPPTPRCSAQPLARIRSARRRTPPCRSPRTPCGRPRWFRMHADGLAVPRAGRTPEVRCASRATRCGASHRFGPIEGFVGVCSASARLHRFGTTTAGETLAEATKRASMAGCEWRCAHDQRQRREPGVAGPNRRATGMNR